MLDLALLGAPALYVDGEPAALGLSQKSLALLALLTCNWDRPLNRTWLAQQLWPDAADAEARASLRRHLYKIAKAFPSGTRAPLTLTKHSAQWNANAGVRADVVVFLQSFDRPSRHADALALYRGPLCVGVEDEAILVQREHLESAYASLCARMLEAARDANDLPQQIAVASRMLAHDRFSEPAGRALAAARLDSGDRAGAVRDLNALVQRLRAELAVEPEPETQALLARALERSPDATPSNLPASASSLVGRERALHDLAKALASHRLVTVLGPGGIGKTRIAGEVARAHLRAYPDGVWFVDLAESRTVTGMLERIAATLEITISNAGAAHSLATALSDSLVLLVLDNCEQLEPGAGHALDALLQSTRVTLLATSRRHLQSEHETAFRLPPLEETSGVRLFLERASAVAPALEPAPENLERIAAIVRRLDALPLAIELAAARANLMSLESMLRRITADPESFGRRGDERRHATLTSTIRWSYDLLSPEQQVLFARLAAFHGPFDLEACEAICAGDSLPAGAVLPLLSDLVENSLLAVGHDERGTPRYRLLETIHTFASKTQTHGGATADRHARYYIHLAAEAQGDAEQTGDSAYLRTIRANESNIAQAVKHAASLSDSGLLQRAVAALSQYWKFSGTAANYTSLYETLAHTERPDAQLCTALGRWYSDRGDWHRARGYHLQAADLYEAAGEEWRAVMSRSVAAHADSYLGASLHDDVIPQIRALLARLETLDAPLWTRGRLLYDTGAMLWEIDRSDDSALRHMLDALAVMRQVGRTDYIGAILIRLCHVYGRRGNFDAAMRCVDESVELLRAEGIHNVLADALRSRARLLIWQERPLPALRDCIEALDCLQRAYEERYLFWVLSQISLALAKLGQHAAAAHVLGYLQGLGSRSQFRFDAMDVFNESAIARLRDELGQAYEDYLQLGAALQLTDVRKIAEQHLAGSRSS